MQDLVVVKLDLPVEVQNFARAVEGIPGIIGVDLRKTFLPDIGVADLALPGSFADLPAAALRRTAGGLADEVLLSLHFAITRDDTGLKGLELLTWWVRDMARAGENIQLRADARPPWARNAQHLGVTLGFVMEWFCANPSANFGRLLQAMNDAAASVETFADLYQGAFDDTACHEGW